MTEAWLVLAGKWLVAWQAKSAVEHVGHGLAGLMGGAVYAAVASPRLVMPHREANVLQLGFGGNLMIGVVAGVVVDTAFPVACIGAVLAPAVVRLSTHVLLPGLASVALGWARRTSGGDTNEDRGLASHGDDSAGSGG